MAIEEIHKTGGSKNSPLNGNGLTFRREWYMLFGRY
jgi:hypothetical protein